MNVDGNATVDQYTEEAEQLFGDQLWRLNHLYWIINEKGERVRFQMNEVQFDLYSNLWYMNLILKSRQHGITTEMCIFMLDTALFNSNVKCAIIADGRETAEQIFETKVKYPYEQLDESLRAVLPARTDTTRELKFSNNSSIAVSTSARGLTVNYLHISEFGKRCRQVPGQGKRVSYEPVRSTRSTSASSSPSKSTAQGNAGYLHDYTQQRGTTRSSRVP